MHEYNTYTGVITYKDIEFTFVFDKKELKLIPPKDKKDEVRNWFRKSIATGVYVSGDPLYITEILYGSVNETVHNIIFIPSKNTAISNINSTLIIKIDYYILNKKDKEKIDRIAIKGPEITHIFPTTVALNKIDWSLDGKIGVSTKSFDETTTAKEKFNMNDNDLFIYFGISVSGTYKTGQSPISLDSTMYIEFDSTDDYEFIISLIKISKQLIQYLCYRRNIIFSKVELAAPTQNGLHDSFATLYESNQINIEETYPNEKEKLIKYDYIQGHLGEILNDIISGKIYLGHIPESYEIGRRKNAGSFILITAGFEWEFERSNPNGIEKDEKTKKAEDNVTNIIENLIKENTGKAKEIFKFLKKLIGADSLESRIVEYGKCYGYISNIFGDNLYNINNEQLDYRQMGKRLAEQRNNFAHGNIDKEFIGLSLLDLIYLEYIIYIMQLKFYKLDEDNIKYAINDLFGCNIAL